MEKQFKKLKELFNEGVNGDSPYKFIEFRRVTNGWFREADQDGLVIVVQNKGYVTFWHYRACLFFLNNFPWDELLRTDIKDMLEEKIKEIEADKKKSSN